jgi:chromosome segregation ATPase
VGAEPADARLAHAAELERRDAAVARELELVGELGDRAATLRARAHDVRAALERAPAELDELEERRSAAEAAAEEARVEVGRAAARLATVEGARRPRDDELERARRELETAREALTDAESQVERLGGIGAELRQRAESLGREADELVRGAVEVAVGVGALDRVAEGARRDPGTTLEELEEWGAQVRSALFVARGTLETERERIVVEANALGSSVLGEELGASSVAVVRRRLEERLAR